MNRHITNYPHPGGCGECRALKVCNFCGDALGMDRCTNGRCLHCHATVCEPGGAISLGHGFGPKALRRG